MPFPCTPRCTSCPWWCFNLQKYGNSHCQRCGRWPETLFKALRFWHCSLPLHGCPFYGHDDCCEKTPVLGCGWGACVVGVPFTWNGHHDVENWPCLSSPARWGYGGSTWWRNVGCGPGRMVGFGSLPCPVRSWWNVRCEGRKEGVQGGRGRGKKKGPVLCRRCALERGLGARGGVTSVRQICFRVWRKCCCDDTTCTHLSLSQVYTYYTCRHIYLLKVYRTFIKL